jgi:hypothetical protein
MLTSKGFGLGQAPTSADALSRYEVLRGIVINGPKKVGDIVALNPRSQVAVELLASGKIRLIDVVSEPVVETPATNRAVLTSPTLKRGKKHGRN